MNTKYEVLTLKDELCAKWDSSYYKLQVRKHDTVTATKLSPLYRWRSIPFWWENQTEQFGSHWQFMLVYYVMLLHIGA